MGKTPKRQQPSKSWRRPDVAGIRIMGSSHVYWLFRRLRNDGRVTVGRTRNREIQIRNDLSVLRRHCEIIHVGGGQFLLRDLGSVNPIEVSYRSGYDGWHEEYEVILEPGLYIKVGESIIIPVDAKGACPITVWHERDMALKAEKVYGSSSAAARHVGRTRQWIRNVVLAASRILR